MSRIRASILQSFLLQVGIINGHEPQCFRNVPQCELRPGDVVCTKSSTFDADGPGTYSTGETDMLYGHVLSIGQAEGCYKVKWEINAETTEIHRSFLRECTSYSV